MSHLQTDGAQVFSRWHNDGMTGYRKRPRDPAQLVRGAAREDEQPKKANHEHRTPKSPGRSYRLRKICPGRLPVLWWRGKPGMSVVLIHPEMAQQRPPSGARGRCFISPA